MIDKALIMDRKKFIEKIAVSLTGFLVIIWFLSDLMVTPLFGAMVGLIGITIGLRNYTHLIYVQAIFDDLLMYAEERGSNQT